MASQEQCDETGQAGGVSRTAWRCLRIAEGWLSLWLLTVVLAANESTSTWLVRFRDGTSQARQAEILHHAGIRTTAIRRFAPQPRNPLKPLHLTQSYLEQLTRISVQSPLDSALTVEDLTLRPEVLYVVPNERVKLAVQPRPYRSVATDDPDSSTPSSEAAPEIAGGPSRVPDDFDFSLQWALQNTGQTEGQAGSDIHATHAWTKGTGSREVIVAVIDTGIDFLHPDLEANIWFNRNEIPGNGLDDDANGFVDDARGYDLVHRDPDPWDDVGHGTHVAGIIGAVGDNQIGVAGVSWHVSLMGVKVFDDQGDADLDQVLEGLRYAVANGAHIINASWGLTNRNRALEEAVQDAQRHGVLVVAAAGNQRNDRPYYPAAFDGVIAVAATDHADRLANFSNFGSWVDLTAPGQWIYSTVPGATYDHYSGTSMAAPHVTGVAALVRAQRPDLDGQGLENLIRNTVEPIPMDRLMGAGRLDAAEAIRVTSELPLARLALPETLAGEMTLRGEVSGSGVTGFRLEYGTDRFPTNWNVVREGTQALLNDVIVESLDSSQIADGLYTFRLSVTNQAGLVSRDRAHVQVRNVAILSPANNDILGAGRRVQIQGTVFGAGRRFRVEVGTGLNPAQWQDRGIRLQNDGQAPIVQGALATWDTSTLRPDTPYTLRLQVWDAEGQLRGETRALMLFLDSQLKPGWPQTIPIRGALPVEDWRSALVADLDHNGFEEIVLVDPGNEEGQPAQLMLWGADGSLRWTVSLGDSFPYADVPVAGDIDGDGFLEVFVDAGATGLIRGFRHDGSELPAPWPVRMDQDNWGKILADLDGDGRAEIIALSQGGLSQGQGDDRELVVLRGDGTRWRSWRVAGCLNDTDAMELLPVAVDLDGDGTLEVLVVQGCSELAAYSTDSASPLWRTRLNGTILASPVAGDVDGNGRHDLVVVATGAEDAPPSGGVYLFDHRGNLQPHWPVLTDESFITPAALADFDGDGDLEICLVSASSKRVHVVHHNGFEAKGWPSRELPSSAKSSPVIGDLDGDGRLDVALASPGSWSTVVRSGDIGAVGGVKAWNFDGQPLDLQVGSPAAALPMESSGGPSTMKAAPITLTDMDRDGLLDIVGVSVQDAQYYADGTPARRKNRSTVYVWELAVPYEAPRFPWPTFQGNPQRNGWYRPPDRVNQPPVIGAVPNQTIGVGGEFRALELDRFVEDHDHSVTQLAWVADEVRSFEVVISSNRRLTVTPRDLAWTGSEIVHLRVTDPDGGQTETAVTYTVKADFVPPRTQADAATTLEDTPVDIAVLANDALPTAGALTLFGVNRPAEGSARVLQDGRVRYTPARNFHGTDSFEYYAIDAAGGIAAGLVSVDILSVNDPPALQADEVVLQEDTSVTIDVLNNDTDPDGDPIELVTFGEPKHGTASALPHGSLLYEPMADYAGLDQFEYVVADAEGLLATNSVIVRMEPVEDQPTAEDQSFSINRNTFQSVNLLGADPDGDHLTFEVIEGPSHGELYNYPAVAVYYPRKGYAGPDRFTYVSNDGKQKSSIAMVTLQVLASNNPPQAVEQTLTTRVNQPLNIALEATDVDEDTLTLSMVIPPNHGTLTGEGTNFVYTPQKDFLGLDSFSYSASDPWASSAPAVINLEVTDRNTPPKVEDARITVLVNTPTNITARASDPENSPLTFQVVSLPNRGTLSGSGPVYLYEPRTNYVGMDRFIFKVSDGESESTTGVVAIQVKSTNLTPLVTNQTLRVSLTSGIEFPLRAGDPDGDSLQAVVLEGVQHGRLFGHGTRWTYIADAGYLGPDRFTYKVWDGTAYSQEATVRFQNVEPAPPKPPSGPHIHPFGNGRFRISATVDPAFTCQLEVSRDLSQWTAHSAMAPDDDGSVSWIIDAPLTEPTRFYRLVLRAQGP